VVAVELKAVLPAPPTAHVARMSALLAAQNAYRLPDFSDRAGVIATGTAWATSWRASARGRYVRA
jgi:hypothetical protein